MSVECKCDLCKCEASPYGGPTAYGAFGLLRVTVRRRWFHGLPFGTVTARLDICTKCQDEIIRKSLGEDR